MKKTVILLLGVLLLSCGAALSGKTKTAEGPEKYLDDAFKARVNFPLEGDVRIIDGREYVYGKNIKYGDTAFGSFYVWVPREVYTPSLVDTLPGRIGYPVARNPELSDIEERVSRLEQAEGRASPPKKRPPDGPVTDGSGRAWTMYFRNDDGVEWFMDEGTLKRTRDGIEIWRRRTFPRWAFQKEIVTLDDLNCSEERYRTLELRATGWDGSFQKADKASPWANVYSSSPEHYLMKVYCN